MTTFQSRKAIRDYIAGLVVTDDSWSNAYSGMPDFSVIAGQSPICTVLSDGTSTEFAGMFNNPREHRFIVTTWVLYRRNADGWTYDEAEDKLDELEATFAQIIRDNASGGAVCDLLQFDSASSQIDRMRTETGDIYITESRVVIATLNNGAV